MSRLRVHNFVVTLDGFATGEDQSLAAPFGTAQDEFLPWFGRVRVWRPEFRPGGTTLTPSATESIAAAWGAAGTLFDTPATPKRCGAASPPVPRRRRSAGGTCRPGRGR